MRCREQRMLFCSDRHWCHHREASGRRLSRVSGVLPCDTDCSFGTDSFTNYRILTVRFTFVCICKFILRSAVNTVKQASPLVIGVCFSSFTIPSLSSLTEIGYIRWVER